MLQRLQRERERENDDGWGSESRRFILGPIYSTLAAAGRAALRAAVRASERASVACGWGVGVGVGVDMDVGAAEGCPLRRATRSEPA